MPYLTDVKGFSGESVWNDIFPVYTYANFAFTLLAAPASQVRRRAVCRLTSSQPDAALPLRVQLFGCKACIVAGAACRLATRLFLLWGRSLASMQVMQVAYGAGVAAEVVFNAYVFALVVRMGTRVRGVAFFT